MKLVTFAEFGNPASVVQLDQRPDPVLGSGQVLVRMTRAPINPSDLMTIRGVYGRRPELPATVGYEGVGVVQSGSGLLARLYKGKRVVVLHRDGGTWSTHTCVPARQVIPVGSRLTDDQAAMFFVNPATAWVMTQEELKVARGEWVLQTAAGSALGRMVVRLGKQLGFKTINVVRSESHVESLGALGADKVIVFDGERDDPSRLHESVRNVVGSNGVRCAIDPVGGATGSAAVGCLGPGGQLLVFGTLSDTPLTFSSRALMTVGASVRGFWLSNYMNTLRLPKKLRLVRKIGGLLERGVLTSETAELFPLDDVANAVIASEQPVRTGKILLNCE